MSGWHRWTLLPEVERSQTEADSSFRNLYGSIYHLYLRWFHCTSFQSLPAYQELTWTLINPAQTREYRIFN